MMGMCALALKQQMTSTILLGDFESVFMRGSRNATRDAASYSYSRNTLDVTMHTFDYLTFAENASRAFVTDNVRDTGAVLRTFLPLLQQQKTTITLYQRLGSLLDSRHLCFPPQLGGVNATHRGRNLTLAGGFADEEVFGIGGESERGGNLFELE